MVEMGHDCCRQPKQSTSGQLDKAEPGALTAEGYAPNPGSRAETAQRRRRSTSKAACRHAGMTEVGTRTAPGVQEPGPDVGGNGGGGRRRIEAKHIVSAETRAPATWPKQTAAPDI